jgi:hypothetical protein
MLTQDPVKIPEIPKKIRFKEKDGTQYVQYLEGRKYDSDKKHNVPNWVNIGKKIESMPSMMYPNDNYERIFCEEEREVMEESKTPEEEQFTRDSSTYTLYNSFFEGLYHEFKQQTRKNGDYFINAYKADSINKVLLPLKEMMQGEPYAELLGLITSIENEEDGMTFSDAMILLTQYKSALAKYRRERF